MASGYVKGRRSSGKRYMKGEDLHEEDVWGFMEDLGASSSSVPKQRNPKPFSSSSSSSRNLLSTPRMIPRKEMMIPSKEYSKRSSAPVSIPRTNRQMMVHGNGPSWVVNGYGDDHDDGVDEDDDDGGDDDDEIVPPHEYIARRLARTQISSFSVCEGVGRKLKGRDLSEVRNDVLRKTGFLET